MCSMSKQTIECVSKYEEIVKLQKKVFLLIILSIVLILAYFILRLLILAYFILRKMCSTKRK